MHCIVSQSLNECFNRGKTAARKHCHTTTENPPSVHKLVRKIERILQKLHLNICLNIIEINNFI